MPCLTLPCTHSDRAAVGRSCLRQCALSRRTQGHPLCRAAHGIEYPSQAAGLIIWRWEIRGACFPCVRMLLTARLGAGNLGSGMQMKSLLSVCGVMAGLIVSSPAQAICSQANAAGTWIVTGLAHLSNGDIGWNACKLVINAAGKFSTISSSCSESDNLSSRVSGSVKLVNAAECAYQGSFTFASFGTTRVIRLATLSLDHQIVSGVVGGTGYGPGAIFTMVKIK